MGNCFPKKYEKNKKEFINLDSLPNENHLDEINTYVESNMQKVNNDILNKYNKIDIIDAFKCKWWELKTDIKNYNLLYENILLDINKIK